MTDVFKLCIVQPTLDTVSETFLRAHAKFLPSTNTVVGNQNGAPTVEGRPIVSQSVLGKSLRATSRALGVATHEEQTTKAYCQLFSEIQPDVVLAEYGTTGVTIHEACKRSKIPFVVHFHGYDASKYDVLNEFGEAYKKMFQDAAAVVGVSKVMRARLIEMGAKPEHTIWNPCGIDCEQFRQGNPQDSPPTFLTVGRFVPKKAPDLALKSFAGALEKAPDARLRMIGDGPKLAECQELARSLDVVHAVEFLGALPHDAVAEEMRNARALIQHSMQAPDGDCEGTPVSVMEAGASGLPVISTRHAGIPDVVLEGETGLLVEEGDTAGMAEHIAQLAGDPELAGKLGQAARKRVAAEFSMEKSIAGLHAVLAGAVNENARQNAGSNPS